METRLTGRYAAAQLAAFIAPLIETLGGISASNDFYYEFLGLDGDSPDNRKLFRGLVNATRRIGAQQAFTLGLFLRKRFSWCNPLTLLYASGHLDRYVLILAALFENVGVTDDMRSVVWRTPLATWYDELDGWKCRYDFPMLPRREKPDFISFGAHFSELTEESFDDIWSSVAPPSFDHTVKEDYRRRHQARSKSVVGDDFMALLKQHEYLVSAEIRKPAHPALLLSFECARIADLDPNLKRIPVTDYLKAFLRSNIAERRQRSRPTRTERENTATAPVRS